MKNLSNISKINFYILFFLAFFCCSYANPKVEVIFRFDDFHMTPTPFNYSLLNLFTKYNIPLCLGVIPNKDDTLFYNFNSDQLLDFRQRIRNKEIEIALHGYNHKDNGLNSRYHFIKHYNSEFKNLTFLEQYYRISTAKNVLEKLTSTHINTFIPPWNSYDRNTLDVLYKLHFNIVSSDMNGISSTHPMAYIPVYNENIDELPSIIEHNKGVNTIINILIHPYSLSKNEDYTEMSDKLYNDLERVLKTVSQMPNIEFHSFNEIATTEVVDAKRYKLNKTQYYFFARILHLINKNADKSYNAIEQQQKIHLWYVAANIALHILIFIVALVFMLFLKKMLKVKAFAGIMTGTTVIVSCAVLIWISQSPAFISLLSVIAVFNLGLIVALLIPVKKMMAFKTVHDNGKKSSVFDKEKEKVFA